MIRYFLVGFSRGLRRAAMTYFQVLTTWEVLI
jgi:hypothetical protein